MKVAIIFDNLGPYHCARLGAAAKLMKICVLEVHRTSNEYAWDRVDSGEAFERRTLYQQGELARSNRELKSRLFESLNEERPDVIAIPGWSSGAASYALEWALSNGTPAVIMSESNSWDESRQSWKEWIKRYFVAQASGALVGGSSSRDYIVELGFPEKAVSLGYDVIENEFFKSASRAARSETGPLPPYFLTSCRFIEKKNLYRLLDAYASFTKTRQQPPSEMQAWNMCLLGDGELKPQLIAYCKNLGLNVIEAAPWEPSLPSDSCPPPSATVFFPGFRQVGELPKFYAHAGVLIHPSTTEQWGLVVNEAMACGLPVAVSRRCGCAKDLVQEGSNGYTFDPYNTNQISDLMLEVAEASTERLSEMGRESLKIIASWGPSRFATGLLAASEHALAIGPSKKSIIGLVARKLVAMKD